MYLESRTESGCGTNNLEPQFLRFGLFATTCILILFLVLNQTNAR